MEPSSTRRKKSDKQKEHFQKNGGYSAKHVRILVEIKNKNNSKHVKP